jgi:hypothetical protein
MQNWKELRICRFVEQKRTASVGQNRKSDLTFNNLKRKVPCKLLSSSQTIKMTVEFFSLPPELTCHILSLLAPRDICRCAMVGHFPLFHLASWTNSLVCSTPDLHNLLECGPGFCGRSIQAWALCSGLQWDLYPGVDQSFQKDVLTREIDIVVALRLSFEHRIRWCSGSTSSIPTNFTMDTIREVWPVVDIDTW